MSEPHSGAPLRLTAFAHGGGCGCKIAPGVLREILLREAPAVVPPELLVGSESADDAAVYRLSDEHAVVATTDFFMPIVDDPFDFGRIAATNALSDVYAMGARPLFALALLAMPVSQLPIEVIRRIAEGGEAACAAAGIVVAGGHTIDSVEPIYGLAAIGVVRPDRVRRNGGARPGDALVLGKPLGVGVYSAALKREALPAGAYEELIATATQLNTAGMALAELDAVHAMTDVTGFGLLGHLDELCRASGVGAALERSAVPWLEHARALAEAGFVTGASNRNWASYGERVRLQTATELDRALLCDPQTSGGLLVACAPEATGEVLAIFAREGQARAAVVGRVTEGSGIAV